MNAVSATLQKPFRLFFPLTTDLKLTKRSEVSLRLLTSTFEWCSVRPLRVLTSTPPSPFLTCSKPSKKLDSERAPSEVSGSIYVDFGAEDERTPPSVASNWGSKWTPEDNQR